MKIYVCSPLRDYDYHTAYSNIEKAKEYCRFIAMGTGNIPIAPHIYCTEFLNDNIHEERTLGMNIGLELLENCEEVWVFGDHISDGMAKEIEYALELEMTVKFYTADCKRRNEDESNTNETKANEPKTKV